MERIALASASPRRMEILSFLGIPFESLAPQIDESVCDGLEPEHRVAALAEKKALAGENILQAKPSSAQPLRFVLAADTLVAFHLARAWKTIGKPRDRKEARAMLGYMAGKTHRVFTGLCLLDRKNGERHSLCAASSVRFAPMTGPEIEWYLDSEEWRGAAGAYRIQGRGSCFISALEGSWSCVMGLPIRELYVMLNKVGYDFRGAPASP